MTDAAFKRAALAVETRADLDRLVERTMRENGWPQLSIERAYETVQREARGEPPQS